MTAREMPKNTNNRIEFGVFYILVVSNCAKVLQSAGQNSCDYCVWETATNVSNNPIEMRTMRYASVQQGFDARFGLKVHQTLKTLRRYVDQRPSRSAGHPLLQEIIYPSVFWQITSVCIIGR